MRSPVRGGLKGGRRSVKRGQSVEFADFRDYAPSSLRRRLRHLMLAERLSSISELTERVRQDPAWLERLVAAFTMNRPEEEREAAQRWIASKERVSAERLRGPRLEQ